MTNLTVINQNGTFTVDSREVAEMVDKRHDNLLRDIENYSEIILNSNLRLGVGNFFIPSNYQDVTGRNLKCFLLTRKGCDLVANKMTGEKGVLFTATYVTKFEEMEQTLKAPVLKPMTQSELTAAIAQNQVEIERTANTALEIATKLDTKLTKALDIFTTPLKDDWRHEMNDKINQMCIGNGLSYLQFRHDIYVELESTARVDLNSRQLRLMTRMKKNGSTVADCKAISKIDIVERDPKLKPIFEGIVRKYQAKYAVA